MAFIRNLFDQMNNIVEKFVSPFIDWVVEFLLTGEYFIISLILAFVGILVLIGLLRWLRKMPKLLVLVLILIAIVFGLWLLA